MVKTALAAALVALGTGVAVAPEASATPSSYLYAMHNLGFYSPGGDATLLDWGYRVCNDMYAGGSPAYSAANIEMQTSQDFQGAMQVVILARHHLC